MIQETSLSPSGFFNTRHLSYFEWIVVGVLFLLQGIYFWILPPNFLDEGIWLELTRWVDRDFKPYVDFPSVYAPFYLRILSEGVTALGGELIHLRLFMGCVQGLICYLLLRWTLRHLANNGVSLFFSLLAAITIAHPTHDATMFWGLRYYSALLWLTPLCMDMLGEWKVTSVHKSALYFFWAFLFFYSGEAGVIAAPTLFVYLVYEVYFSSEKLRTTLKRFSLGLAGVLACVVILGQEAWLYARELLFLAPVTYKDMGFAYPGFSASKVHYYFPFLVLGLAIMCSYKIQRRHLWSLVAVTLSLLPALKVATSRSDNVHLAYAYPFVIFLMFLLLKSTSIVIQNPRHVRFWKLFWTGSLTMCMVLFLSRDYFWQVKATVGKVRHSENRIYNPQWGLWMEKDVYGRLKESSQRVVQKMATRNQKLYVFPFQQILYSELGIRSLFIEPIQPCSLKKTRAECSRNFNYTYPDFVLWVPEGSLYSWAFDAFYSGFEYPEAFETLSNEFDEGTLLGGSGWYLFERTRPANSTQLAAYSQLNAPDFETCEPNRAQCPYLDVMAESMRLPKTTELKCLRPTMPAQTKLMGGFGVEISKETIQNLATEIHWVCKDLGLPSCHCSRTRQRSLPEEPYIRWAWRGFLDWTKENSTNIGFFGVLKK